MNDTRVQLSALEYDMLVDAVEAQLTEVEARARARARTGSQYWINRAEEVAESRALGYFTGVIKTLAHLKGIPFDPFYKRAVKAVYLIKDRSQLHKVLEEFTRD